ncbi:sensor histidine kinase [Granulicella sibirica]|uniref:Two-component system sensor protein n=1 Tax=Granulicella sibirica TaxID=2479048 RepID=A0A4Q0T1Q7_9BACT|nr:ATP-binding protein [Granulicella sibirica]RXH57107.1 two-component system sensor protein [Granulicella sibirica]
MQTPSTVPSLVLSTLAIVDTPFTPIHSFAGIPLYKGLGTLAALALLGVLYLFRLRREAARVRWRLYQQLAEHERLKRERHDTFFQGMQGLLLCFQTGTSLLRKDDPARRIFEEALQQSDRVMTEGRDLDVDSHPVSPASHDLSLAYAAAGQELQIIRPADFKVLVIGASESLRTAVFDELQRLGREALTNAFRHAKARRIEAELNYQSNELRVFFRDNGVGIDPEALCREPSRRCGLPRMQEQARKIGARLDVWSRAGAGTEVEIRISAAAAYRSAPPQRRSPSLAGIVIESEGFYD